MKKNWKKVLSLILALSMVLTMNTSVFATSLEGTDPAAAPAPAAETPAAEEPAQTPEAAPEATEPAPEAAAPAAEETEAPAAAEEPAKAEEAAEAVKEEAPAAAPATETEKEDAAEGTETGDPYILTDWSTPKTISDMTVTFEKYASVRVSENEASIIVKNGSAAIYGTNSSVSYDKFTITVEKGATLYAGYQFDQNGGLISKAAEGLQKVTVKGEGTVVINPNAFAKTDISFADNTNVKVNVGSAYIISANDVYFAETRDTEHTTWNIKKGCVAKFYQSKKDEDGDAAGFTPNWFGAPENVSKNTLTAGRKSAVLVKNEDGTYKAGTVISKNSVLKLSDVKFGDILFYFDAEEEGKAYYYVVPSQYEAPKKEEFEGYYNNAMFDGAIRKDGINIGQLNPKFKGTVEYILVSANNAVQTPSVNAAKWQVYANDSLEVFKNVLDDTKVREGVTYTLWARRVKGVDEDDNAELSKFISEPTSLGSFTWTARPTSPLTLSVDSTKENYYVGDVTDFTADFDFWAYYYNYNRSNFLTNGTLTYGLNGAEKELELDSFKDDELHYKKNTITNRDYYKYYDEDGDSWETVPGDPYVRLNVRYKDSASIVGYLDAYIISANGTVSAADMDKLTREELNVNPNNAFVKDMLNTNEKVHYIDAFDAGDYFVKTFFESNNSDFLPYDNVSSNTVKVTIKKAPVEISPYLPSYEGKYNNHTLSTMTTVSGDIYLKYVSAYISNKITNGYVSEYGWPVSVNVLKDGKNYDWSKADKELGVGTYSLSIEENKYELLSDDNGSLSNNYAFTTAEGAIYHTPRTLVVTKPGEGGITSISVGSLTAMHGTTSENVINKVYVEFVSNGVKYRAGKNSDVDGKTISINAVYTKTGDTYSIISNNNLMSEINAGTTVYVSMDQIKISVNKVEQTIGGYIPVTIVKRPISITVKGNADRGAKASEITVSAADAKGDVQIEDPGYFGWSYGYCDLKISEKEDPYHFKKGENTNIPDYYIQYKKAYFQGDSLISGSIKVKNADAIDTSVVGAEYYLDLDTPTLADPLKTNYEISSVTGKVTINPRYFVYYVFSYDGEKKVNKKEFKPGVEGYNGKMTITPYKDAADYNAWVKSMAEKYPEDGDEIVGWRLSREGNKYVDSCGIKESFDNMTAYDYIAYAVIGSYPRTGIKVESIAPVEYTGLAYVASQTGTATKANQINSLELNVKGRADNKTTDTWTDLNFGSDYTVTYKNNTNASVKFTSKDALGAFTAADPTTQLFASKAKRPQVIITGKGKYAGWQTTVYFDIYPTYIGSDDEEDYIETPSEHYGDGRAQITGLKENYFVAANGKTAYSYKVQNIQYPSKVTLTQYPEYENGYANYAGPNPNTSKPKTLTLKKNTDYDETLYKKDAYDSWVATTDKKVGIGEYEVVVKGKGNYYGTTEETFYVKDKSKAVDFSKFKTVKVKSSLKWVDTIGKGRTAAKAASISIGSLIMDYKLVEITAGSGRNKVVVGPVAGYDGNGDPIYNYTVEIRQYKADGTQYWEDPWTGYDEELSDAGTYTITIRPNTRKGSYFYNDGQNIKVDYVGSITKKFTIKGEALKAGNFKLLWKSKKVNQNNTSDKQTVTLKKTVKPEDKQYIYSDTPKDGGEVYVYDLTPDVASKWASENYKAYNKNHNPASTGYSDGGGVWRDFEVYDGGNSNHWISVAGERAFYDNGLEYKAEQVDVYKYKMTYKPKNKDVGTYTVHVGTSGLYGIEGVDITYKRTGTANKILSIFGKNK